MTPVPQKENIAALAPCPTPQGLLIYLHCTALHCLLWGPSALLTSGQARPGQAGLMLMFMRACLPASTMRTTAART